MSDGWSSSEDEWEDSPVEVPTQAQTNLVVPWDTLGTFEYTPKDHKYYHGLKSTLKLENFGVTSDGQKIIHRCEPLKDPRSGEKHYPTLVFDFEMLSYQRVLVIMTLFHPKCGHVHVRFPDLKDKVDPVSEAYPHLVFNGFNSTLGDRISDILKYLFPLPKVDAKRLMTFNNKDDYISMRHHIYKKDDHKTVVLKELGPRFEMKPYQIILGTIDNAANA